MYVCLRNLYNLDLKVVELVYCCVILYTIYLRNLKEKTFEKELYAPI